ncbi:MAG: type II CRISPR RNA-guided endonuclease Cas9 [Bryobacteraceae bacterium]
MFNTGEIQIEHIVPFSRSLDDSFANKTLAFASVNKTKGNRTPHAAFGGSPEWESILQNVRAFQGPYARHKLQRFQWDEERVNEMLADFTERQLNDTRYASRLAARYVLRLYGGRYDADGQRIFVSPGQVTAYLRRLWSLEGLLSQDGRKSRLDHRHHAIDAIVIALTGPRFVKLLCDAADAACEVGRRRFTSIAAPWDGFVESVRSAISDMIVSPRVNRKVGGAMHDESLYGNILRQNVPTAVIRKPVHKLSKAELENIVDPGVRERVLLQVGMKQGDIKQLEADPPVLPTRSGREIPIRKVRLAVPEATRCIAQGPRVRHVLGDEYHHWEILRSSDARGRVRHAFVPVTVQQAMERVRDRRPVVCRSGRPDSEFVCSISKGEVMAVGAPPTRKLVLVCALEAAMGTIGFKDLADARPYSPANKNRERITVGRLFGELAAEKVNITVLGRCFPAHD